MPLIEYIRSSDYSDCETCGGNYDDGIVLSLDGKVIVDKEASASCWDNENWDLEKALIALLNHLGYTIHEKDEDGRTYNVTVSATGNITKDAA